jgi:hypothetical protein
MNTNIRKSEKRAKWMTEYEQTLIKLMPELTGNKVADRDVAILDKARNAIASVESEGQ